MRENLSGTQVSTFKLRRRTPGTFVLVPYPKQGRSIRCQGQLEAAAAQILAACPFVQQIEEQPLSIWYARREGTEEISLLDGPPTKTLRKERRCSYIVPDFLVTMHSGAKRLVEVKPSAKLARPDVQRKLAVGEQFAARQGWTFHVVTERELFGGPLLANIRLLGRFRRVDLPESLFTSIEAFVSQSQTTFCGLLQHFQQDVDESDLRTAVLHLVAAGRIDVNLFAAPISADALLFPGGTIRWDPFDSVWGPSGSATNGRSASSANSVPSSLSPKI